MEQFGTVLKDVRYAYRILALYQRRVLDTVDYVMKAYNLNYGSGWAKFSEIAKNGNRAKLECWSWDWLPMYVYHFCAHYKDFNGEKFAFSILHLADTGYYDESVVKKIDQRDIEAFNRVENSQTKFYFTIRNSNGSPIMEILEAFFIERNDSETIVQDDCIAKAYDMTRFVNQEKTDDVINEFNQLVIDHFGFNLKG